MRARGSAALPPGRAAGSGGHAAREERPRRRRLLRLVVRQLLPLSLAAALPAGCAGQVYPTIDTWNYADQVNWATIPATQCAVVGTQSPIDITTSQAHEVVADKLTMHQYGRQLGPVVWSHKNALVNVTVAAEHYTWTVSLERYFSETSKTLVRGKTLTSDFDLRSFSFHSPSEHTHDGKHYDMEVQFLHTTAAPSKDPWLMTSVMMQVDEDGQDNEYLNQFWGRFPTTATGLQAKPLGRPILHPYWDFYPEDRSYYAYNGSRSTPPCEVPVLWIVFEHPVTISARQLEAFRWAISEAHPTELLTTAGGQAPPGVTASASSYKWDAHLGMNSRLPQELGDRIVRYVEQEALPTASPIESAKGALVLWGAVGLFVLCGSLCVVGLAMWHVGHFPRLAKALGYEEEEEPYEHFQHGLGFRDDRSDDGGALAAVCGCFGREDTQELAMRDPSHFAGACGYAGMAPASLPTMSDPYQSYPLVGPGPPMLPPGTAHGMALHAYPPPPGYHH